MCLNILYIHHILTIGGGEISLCKLLQGLDKDRFCPVVVCPSAGPLTNRLQEMGIESKVFPASNIEGGRISTLFSILRLAYFLRARNIRMVHVNSLGRLHYVVLACRVLRIPYVFHMRSLLVTNNLHPRHCRLLNGADRVIAISEAVRQALIRIGVVASKISVIYNGVDLSEFDMTISGAQVRREFGLDDNTPVVGIAGRIVPWKGHEEFIRAAAKVKEKVPEARFLIVGEALEEGYLERLEALTRELKIVNEVIFTGFRKDMSQIMAALDVLVNPCWTEAFGRVVTEAMASGKPVVAAAAGGLLEQVVDGITGLLVPPRDHQALAEAMVALLNDRERAVAMGRAGREIVGRRFGIEAHVRAVEALYEELLGDRH